MMMPSRPAGFSAFLIVWIGQVVSLVGTGVTRFAFTIWAWQITGTATALALVGFFSFTPAILISPIAGALIDRWDRRRAMMLSDFAAVTSTLVVLLLYSSGLLEVWHLYITGAVTGFFSAFQFPAYSATVTLMVSKEQYGRASGLLSIAEFGSSIVSPIIAAIALSIIGIGGILVIDIMTFCVALLTLLLVVFPAPSISEVGVTSRGSLWAESLFGFRYIRARPSLLGLQLIFFTLNLVINFAVTLFSPMILAPSGNDSAMLGLVQSTLGAGGLFGSIILSVWGGPRRKIHDVLIGMTLAMCGMTTIGLSRNLPTWALTTFLTMFCVPILNGSSQAIWQSKVEPDVQGRVFATRSLIAQISAPVAMLLSGPLADQVFEPAMISDGYLTPFFGGLIGVGPGAGMALMFFLTGLLGILVGISGYFVPSVRFVEDLLPDYHAHTSTLSPD
jgi:DHA3 family macrolide efflux protein-like MFS transporter